MPFDRLKRREFIALLGGSAAAWPLAARTQQSKLSVIGFLASAAPFNPDNLNDFRKALTDAGYVEGGNVAIEVRAAERYDQLPAMAAELVRQQVAVIVAAALPAALAAKAATTAIPIVFFAGDDPIRAGLVARLNRPGGNLTGMTNLQAPLLLKRFGLLREVAPAADVIGVLFNPENPNTERRLADLNEAARSTGQRVIILNASREGDFEKAFAAAGQQHAGALLISDDFFFGSHEEQLAALAMSHRLPAIYTERNFPAAGGLMGYGVVRGQVYPQIGAYVARILKGARPADLPVVQASKFELVINLKTARALGLTVPDHLLALADEVIE
jgi:putative tryptophan/tyrosine transport system substrate-binding protein